MLEGVRVVDLTSVVFGPYATMALADLGAEVIKIEAPGGDQFRLSGKPANSKRMSPGYIALNRGKKSVVLDLKRDKDKAALVELLKTADIFVHNIRADAIARLGFDAATVQAINPELIYIHCVGFGSNGPYAGLQAYDDVIQAASGAATLAGRVDGTGRPRYIPSLIADKVAGLHGAQAALAAYVHKLRTGEAQFVEVPMFECFSQFMLVEHLAGHTFDPPNGSSCYSRQIDPDRQPFPTSDGYISIVPYTVESWPAVFEVLGEPEFLDSEEFATPALQYRNQAKLYKRCAELTPARKTADWVARFKTARIPCMPVRDMDAMLEDPHLLQTGFFERREHPSEGGYYAMRQPVRYEAMPAKIKKDAPLLGQDTEEVLRMLNGIIFSS